LYIAETGNVQASHRLITPPRHLRHRFVEVVVVVVVVVVVFIVEINVHKRFSRRKNETCVRISMLVAYC